VLFAALLATVMALLPLSVPAQHSINWNDQPSTDTTPVNFSIEGIQYTVPRNYIVWMDNWHGGPQTLVRFKATFPDFAPLTEKTRFCMEAPLAYRPADCTPLEFLVRRGSSEPTDDEQFNNLRKVFRSQVALPGPAGFELYESGPADARMNTYRKRTPEHTLVMECFPHGDLAKAVCSSDSRLDNGAVLAYLVYGAQLPSAERIDTGIRRIVRSFTLTRR
jgi:hypothetical protein